MTVKNKRYLAGIILLFAILVTIRHFIPKPVNWQLSFSGYRELPYGCHVSKDLLSVVFPGKEIEINSASFFVGLKSYPASGRNLIIITDHFSPDDLDNSAMLDYIAQGNTVFISALSFSSSLCDTLKVKTNSTIIDTSLFKTGNESLNLTGRNGSNTKYTFHKRMPDHYFVAYDTANAIQLGSDRAKRPDFLRVDFGKGSVYLHCQPMAFTNFHILYGNYQYACNAFSALPVINTIWDQYYKPGRMLNTSPVRYILSEPALRSAYYLILATLLLYMLFGVRRKQRIIPVIIPPPNSTLNFIKTVGRLYYKSHNHTDLAKKKVIYFREFIKNRYNIKPPFNTPDLLRALSLRSGVEEVITNRLLCFTDEIYKSNAVSRENLTKMHHMIEDFYKNCK